MPLSCDNYHDVCWEELHQHCCSLVKKLPSQVAWKGIVAITRGGLVPAAILSQQLDIRLIDTLCISSYQVTDEQLAEQQGELQILKTISTNAEGNNHGAGWLIIDDLVDTGRTAELARKLLPKAYMTSIYAKPAGKPFVDCYLEDVEQNTWVVFPWENNPLIE